MTDIEFEKRVVVTVADNGLGRHVARDLVGARREHRVESD
jgi:hypothetical protein